LKVGHHTESGRHIAEDWAEDWLQIYADQLANQARQIEANLSAWNAAKRATR
jgi:hypothetical protein